MICPTYIKAFEELLSLGRTHKGAVTKEITLQGKDVLVPTLMSINSLQSDTIKNTFLVVTDLSEHMDEEVKRYTKELELAQIALSESEQRWATTLASIGDAVIATDTSGKIKFMNIVAEKLTGWTLSEASGKPVQDVFRIINEFTRITVDDPVSKVLEKGTIVGLANHTLLLRKDGTEVAIDDSGAPIRDKVGKVTGVVLIFRDIAERRKAEETLKMSEHRFRSLAENAPDVIMRFNPDLRVMYLNPKVEVATGVSAERFIGKTNEEMGMPNELVEMWNDMFRKAREFKQAQQREFDFPSPDGPKTFDLRVVPEYDEKDSLISFLGISRDITERKKAEQEIAKVASFPTLNPNPVIEADFTGKISYANPAAKTILDDTETIGLAHPFLSDWQKVTKIFEDESLSFFKREVKVGEQWYYQTLFHVPRAKLIRIYGIDITERKKAEEKLEEYSNNLEKLVEDRTKQLKDSERLAAIGATAGMVGHDIRNPLQAITGDVVLS